MYKLKRYSINLILLLLTCFLWNDAYAQTKAVPELNFSRGVLTIINNTGEPLALKNLSFQFHYFGEIKVILGKGNFNPAITIVREGSDKLPNNPGHVYTVTLKEVNRPLLFHGESVQLHIFTNNETEPTAFKIARKALEPVPVDVMVSRIQFIQSIKICNKNNFAVPLTNVEFSFKFPGSIYSVSGTPLLNWKVISNSGGIYTLSGGAAGSNFPSDPNCLSPLNIQFYTSRFQPLASAPFVFKAEGVVPPPVDTGSLNVVLPQSPASGLSNSTVTVEGTTVNKQQIVNWGQAWKIDNLPVGAYTVRGSGVDNGQVFYFANPVTVNVLKNTTTDAVIQYQQVPTTPITVTLINAPGPQSVTFKGQKYTLTKNVNINDTVMLPSDSYDVSAVLNGYTITISPNPLNVPTQTAVTLTYQKNTSPVAFFGGYFQSWSSSRAADISNLAPYVTHVYLAFIRPDNSYSKGSMDFRSAGLEFNFSGSSLKSAVATLHQRNPNTKVLVSVGGASYQNWSRFNAKGVADFVNDFGLDGADIDYEVSNPGCRRSTDGLIHCSIDSAYQNIIHSIRVALPRPRLVTVAAFSIAAYGEGKWANSAPTGEYTGMMLPFFRSQYKSDLDLVNVMSYDAGNTYKPTEALAAYSNYWSGDLCMGVEVPPEAWGGHVYTMNEVNSLAQAVKSSAQQRGIPPGMMIWSLQKRPNGTPSSNNPSAQMMATSICQIFGLTNCNDPIFSLR